MNLRTLVLAVALTAAGVPAFAFGYDCDGFGSARAHALILFQERLGIDDIGALDFLAREMMHPAIFSDLVKHDPVLAAAVQFYNQAPERCWEASERPE